jgi:small subunit ribosomal protein S16
MLVIRLARRGSKKRAQYRVVVADRNTGRGGDIVEILGAYNPRRPDEVRIDRERVQHWLARGAHPSDTIRSLLEKEPSAAPAASA